MDRRTEKTRLRVIFYIVKMLFDLNHGTVLQSMDRDSQHSFVLNATLFLLTQILRYKIDQFQLLMCKNVFSNPSFAMRILISITLIFKGTGSP